jgi:hypothetical protein
VRLDGEVVEDEAAAVPAGTHELRVGKRSAARVRVG